VSLFVLFRLRCCRLSMLVGILNKVSLRCVAKDNLAVQEQVIKQFCCLQRHDLVSVGPKIT